MCVCVCVRVCVRVQVCVCTCTSVYVHVHLTFLVTVEFVTDAVDMTEPQVQQMIAKFVTDNISGFTTQV